MQAKSANLLSLIKGPKQFVIPIYQRTYSWQLAQCEQLFHDILRVSSSKDEQQGHFVGSIVYFQDNISVITDVPKLLVIDGQQRLTTVSILILALAHFMKKHPVEMETTINKLHNYYLLNAEEEGDLRYKLLLTRGDKQSYINLLNEVPQDIINRVTANYKFFSEKIKEENAQDIYNGIQRLFVVDVALEKGKDNPQLIFESMNSTGLDLSQADLIRNYVLMGQEIDMQTKLYENYWFPMEQAFGNEYTLRFDAFMRDYLSVKTAKIPRIDAVYEAFKQYVISDKSAEDIEPVVKDISQYASYYANIVLKKEKDADLQKQFLSILRLKVDVANPFLLAVYNDYQEGNLEKEAFLQVLQLVESYVFRRAICGIPTNSLNKTFVNLYKKLNPSNYVESVQAAFQMMGSYQRFPDDAEFERELLTKDVYNFRSRNYLLSKLENYHRKEYVNVEEYTIEHVMPQNPNLNDEWKNMLGDDWENVHTAYLHTLGNLTLTGYNSELSDRPFSYKKTIEGGFNDSPLRLNTFLRQTDRWNQETILQRATELGKKAAEIWFAPKLPQDTLEKYLIKEAHESTSYNIEQYEYLQGDMLDLYNALKKRILNIDTSVKEEYKKLYIAFKATTNFVDIVPQKARLRLSLNMPFDKISDPKELCKDVTGLGRWGNGDVELDIANMENLDDVMDLIQQSFDYQEE